MSRYFIYSLILVALFIPQSAVLGFNLESFYGTNSLKPLINKEATTINLPGGNKYLITDNDTTYLTNDHLGSARLTLNTDNTIQKTIDYTPFGDTLTDTTTGLSLIHISEPTRPY